MNVVLKPSSEAIVKEQLDAGRFRSPDEVIDHALAMLREQEDWAREARERIAQGLQSLDRGEAIAGKEAVRRLRAARSSK